MPVGYYFCLMHEVTLGKIFIAIYGVLATYFSCVMIRLMLTLAPVVCVIAGIAVSELFDLIGQSIRESLLNNEEVKVDDSEFTKVETPQETPKTKVKKQVQVKPEG